LAVCFSVKRTNNELVPHHCKTLLSGGNLLTVLSGHIMTYLCLNTFLFFV